MKIDFFFLVLILLFILVIGITGKKIDQNMPMLPTFAYEKYDDFHQTTYRIHSITIGENEVKYISELKLTPRNEPINEIYNKPYVNKETECTIIDSKNWKCGSIYGHEMVNGILRSNHGYKKYIKFIYIFGIPLFNMD